VLTASSPVAHAARMSQQGVVLAGRSPRAAGASSWGCLFTQGDALRPLRRQKRDRSGLLLPLLLALPLPLRALEPSSSLQHWMMAVTEHSPAKSPPCTTHCA
jgi:hypothetical protein